MAARFTQVSLTFATLRYMAGMGQAKPKTYGKKGKTNKQWRVASPPTNGHQNGGGDDAEDKENTSPQEMCSPEDMEHLDLAGGMSRLHLEGAAPGMPPHSIKASITHPKATFNATRDALILERVSEVMSEATSLLKEERGLVVNITDWTTAIDGLQITKEAEASFSQVFQAIDDQGRMSILKVIELSSPLDSSSHGRATATSIDSLLPEIFITDLLSEVPGYVENKGVHIIVGKPPAQIVEAYEEYKVRKGTQYIHPRRYSPRSAFLLLEQDHAGTVLEDYPLRTCKQMAQVIVSIIMALALAERCLCFEHRDLHENNICVSQNDDDEGSLRVTILDYGLSRIGRSHTGVYFADLEQDTAIFESVHTPGNRMEEIQFANYRRMRATLINKDRPSARGLETWNFNSKPPDWSQHQPFTNVLWLHYLLQYIVTSTRRPKFETRAFTIVFQLLFEITDPASRDQAAPSVWEILIVAEMMGWIEVEDVEEMLPNFLGPQGEEWATIQAKWAARVADAKVAMQETPPWVRAARHRAARAQEAAALKRQQRYVKGKLKRSPRHMNMKMSLRPSVIIEDYDAEQEASRIAAEEAAQAKKAAQAAGTAGTAVTRTSSRRRGAQVSTRQVDDAAEEPASTAQGATDLPLRRSARVHAGESSEAIHVRSKSA